MGKLIGQVHSLLLEGKSAARVEEIVLQQYGVSLSESNKQQAEAQIKEPLQTPIRQVVKSYYTQLRSATDSLQTFINALLDNQPVVTALRI